MPGALPRPSIHLPYHVERRHFFDIMRIHRVLYDARDGCKAELPVQKIFNGNFIGRIKDDRQSPSGSKRAVREVQAWKPVAGRGLKVEMAGAFEIEGGKGTGFPALRVRTG